MEVCSRQRTAQFERRNGKIIAVYRCGKILKACAAAVKLSYRNRRNKDDSRGRLYIEPQLIGDESAVFAAFEGKRCLGLKQVKGIQFKAESIPLLAFEGVDLALNLRKLQRHQIGSVKAAFCLYAVYLKFVRFFAVHCLFR